MEILWKVDMYSSDKEDLEVQSSSGNHEGGLIIDEDGDFALPEKSNTFLSLPMTREQALVDIADFEENRRISNETQMTRNELYWNELTKMQEEAFADNDQLLHYLRCKHSALVAFASALDAIQLDHNPRSRHREKDYDSLSVSTSVSTPTPERTNTSVGPAQKARQELVNLDKVWAQRIFVMAQSMNTDITQPFEQVAHGYVEEVTAMGRRCSNLFHAVRLAEMRVQSYYKYVEDASNALSPMNKEVRRNSFGKQNSLVNIPKSTSNANIGPLQTCHVTQDDEHDMWLLDMRYRVAVVRHLQMREECSRQLGKLLQRAKEAEQKRREAIVRATDQLAELQIDLWLHLPAIAKSSTDVIHTRVSDPNSFPDINTTLRERVNALQHSSCTTSPNKQQLLKRVSVAREETKEEPARLASPLESPMLSRSAVFLRRDGGTIVSTWMPVLLFLTMDRWLHVYDLDPKCERMSEVSAFQTLVAASKKGLEQSVSSMAPGSLCEETEFDPKTSTQMLNSEQFMAPTYSLNLSRCKILFKPIVNDTTFELVEAVPNTGVGAMFKATTDRRYMFRSRSQAEMVDWVVQLKGQTMI